MITKTFRPNLSMVLLVLPLGVPAFFFKGSTLDFRMVQSVFELIFILWFAFVYNQKKSFFFPRYLAFLFVLWAIWAIGAVVFSDRVAPSILRQWEWFCKILFCLCLWGYFKGDQYRTIGTHVIVLSGFLFICAAFLCYWYYLPDPVQYNWVVFPPYFSNIRSFSFYCTAALVLSLSLFPAGAKNKVCLVLLFLFLSVCWGFQFWSGGRGGMVSAVIGICVVFCYIQKSRKAFIFILFAAIVTGFICSGFFEVESYSQGGINSILRSSNRFLSGRLFLWETALARCSGSLFFGLGPDAFRFFPEFRFNCIQPHNALIQFLLDWGVVGAFFYITMHLLLIYKGATGIRKEQDLVLKGIKVSALALVTAFLFYAIVDGVFYHAIPMTFMAYGFAVILLPVSTDGEKMTPSPVRLNGAVVRSMALVLLVVPALHQGVIQSVKSTNVPSPFSFKGRLVRWFPSETNGLERWVEAWKETNPDVALSASIKFANSSMESLRFWKIAASLCLDKRDFNNANRMAENALNDSKKKKRPKLLKEFHAQGLLVGYPVEQD